MASLDDLKSALVKADAAGDTAGAKQLADAIRAAQPQVAAPQAPAGQPSFLGSTVATLNHAVTDLPIVGPLLQKGSDYMLSQTMGRMEGKVHGGLTDPSVGDFMNEAAASKAANDAANPIAAVAGGLAGNLAALGPAAATETGAAALGLSGKLLPRVANSAASTLGLSTADNMARGQAPLTAMENAAGPTAVAAAIPLAGRAITGTAEAATDAATQAMQRKATAGAIAGAPTSADLKSVASQAFEAATGGKPIAISDNAYMRFMGDVQAAEQRFRITPELEPGSTGLLSKLMRIADEANSGAVVDMKDLHILRQQARDVGMGKGSDAAFGNTVVHQLDDFINTLQPSDILGGTDPKASANALMTGVSGWSRATKVGIIEDAVTRADTYKNGMESGLKTSFSNLMRSPDYARFSDPEKAAIREVAKGTSMQNAMSMLGKMGFNPGGTGSHNIVGGSLGTIMSGAALTPILGPVAGPAVGMAASNAAAAGGRYAAERMAVNGANRAAQIAATPNIPTVAPMIVPQLLKSGVQGAELLAKARLLAAQGGQ